MTDATGHQYSWWRLPRAALGPLLAFLAFGTFAGSWAALLPQLQLNAGASDRELGFAMLASAAGAFPAVAISGRLIDRFGGRVVGVALLGLAATAVGTAFSSSALELVLTLLFVGFAAGATDISMNAAVAHVEAESRPLMNLAHALFSIGAAIGGAITGILRDEDWTAPQIMGTLAVAVVLIAFGNFSDRAISGSEEAADAGQSSPTFNPFLVGVGLLVFLSFVAESTAFAWTAIHVEDTFDASARTAGFAVATYFAGSVVGRLVAHVRGNATAPRPLIFASGVLIAIGAAAIASSPTVAPVLVAFLLLGLGTATVAPTLYSVAGASEPTRRGSAIATVAMLGFLGNVISPPVMGFVSDEVGLRAAFGLVAVTGIALAFGALALLRGLAASGPVEPDERVGQAPDNLGGITPAGD